MQKIFWSQSPVIYVTKKKKKEKETAVQPNA